MCTGSIHVNHRMARKTERLVLRKIPDYGAIKGYYPAATKSDGALVCCRGTIEAIIKTVRFEEGCPPSFIKAWEGKRNVKVTLRHRPYQDSVTLPDGKTVLLTGLVEGTRIDIGVPVRVRKPKSAGMQAVEGAVREALALPPDPKPEDEEHEAPKPVEPEREPAPAGDPPKSRRRART